MLRFILLHPSSIVIASEAKQSPRQMNSWRGLHLRPPISGISIGRQPPLDWPERLAEEAPDIVMAGLRPPRLPLA
jgi:hypothetical protein